MNLLESLHFYLLFRKMSSITYSISFRYINLLGDAISGGHFNPAVSVMMAVNGKLSNMNLIGYLLSQVLGVL